jgi:hypothetical protein
MIVLPPIVQVIYYHLSPTRTNSFTEAFSHIVSRYNGDAQVIIKVLQHDSIHLVRYKAIAEIHMKEAFHLKGARFVCANVSMPQVEYLTDSRFEYHKSRLDWKDVRSKRETMTTVYDLSAVTEVVIKDYINLQPSNEPYWDCPFEYELSDHDSCLLKTETHKDNNSQPIGTIKIGEAAAWINSETKAGITALMLRKDSRIEKIKVRKYFYVYTAQIEEFYLQKKSEDK